MRRELWSRRRSNVVETFTCCRCLNCSVGVVPGGLPWPSISTVLGDINCDSVSHAIADRKRFENENIFRVETIQHMGYTIFSISLNCLVAHRNFYSRPRMLTIAGRKRLENVNIFRLETIQPVGWTIFSISLNCFFERCTFTLERACRNFCVPKHYDTSHQFCVSYLPFCSRFKIRIFLVSMPHNQFSARHKILCSLQTSLMTSLGCRLWWNDHTITRAKSKLKLWYAAVSALDIICFICSLIRIFLDGRLLNLDTNWAITKLVFWVSIQLNVFSHGRKVKKGKNH